jgi:hypothetical protein
VIAHNRDITLVPNKTECPPMQKQTLSIADSKFLGAIGVAGGLDPDERRPESLSPEGRDFYPAVVYWRNLAMRYERIATYSWGAWLIVVCLAGVGGICLLTQP